MANKKLLYVLAAILLGAIAGKITGVHMVFFAGVTFFEIFSLLGELFLNALKLVVVPLVAASIITGTARMGGDKSFGKLGLKTFATFLTTTAIAILIGWIVTEIIHPGVSANGTASTHIVDTRTLAIEQAANGGAFSKFEEILLKLIPSNILAVAAQGQMLGLIFFCLLFGYFLPKIESESSRVMLSFWKAIFEIMMKITELVMLTMPLGVFGLVAKVIASTGVETIQSVAYFFGTMLLSLFIFMFFALNALLYFVAKVNPLKHMKAMLPALITGFSTSSSAATLPVSLDCIEQKVGVSNKIASFSLPLGTSLNLAGSSMQVMVAVLFIANVYGVNLNFSTQLVVFLMTWLLSIGVAGIPSASLVSIVIVLTAIGFPADGVALIMAVERILDMFRTTVNVYCNSCSSVLIARSEKEKLKI